MNIEAGKLYINNKSMYLWDKIVCVTDAKITDRLRDGYVEYFFLSRPTNKFLCVPSHAIDSWSEYDGNKVWKDI